MNTLDKQYQELLQDVMENGTVKTDRTGTGTRSVFGRTIRHNMSEGFPLLTLRPIYLKISVEETLFFMRGETDTKKLEDKNITIWKGNTTRKFLDDRGLTHLPEGDMGKGYGWQIRNFGGATQKDGYDQLSEVIWNIKNNSYSRRHVISHWNPLQLDESALPPCHLYQQYNVTDGKLNLFVLLRSWDFYHGAPYNISGYGFWLHCMAKICGLEVGELKLTGVDVHLYNTQLDVSKELIKRTPNNLPTIEFTKEFKTLEGALDLSYDDIILKNYNPLPKQKKIPMSV